MKDDHAKTTQDSRPTRRQDDLDRRAMEWQLTYLLERVGTQEAMLMLGALPGKEVPDYAHKIDYLREFRKYPPTVLLGTFDVVRQHRQQ